MNEQTPSYTTPGDAPCMSKDCPNRWSVQIHSRSVNFVCLCQGCWSKTVWNPSDLISVEENLPGRGNR